MHRSLKSVCFFLAIIFSLTTLQCSKTPDAPEQSMGTLHTNPHPDSLNTYLPTKIAFGSCNAEEHDQPLWAVIAAQEPDLWIWLGDNIYGDTYDMSVLASKYATQTGQPEYKAFTEYHPVIGIWDDHDYGTNDGDKSYPFAAKSKELLLDFLDVPKGAEVYQRPGAYTSYDFSDGQHKVRVILLDGRTFRTRLIKETGAYVPDPAGELLGEAQWTWLEKEMGSPGIDLFVIGCGIQFWSEEHPFEKWANFPSDVARLKSLLSTTAPKAVVFLSGDRHMGEISCIEIPGLSYPVCDATSSGLTHSWSDNPGEQNSHRVGPLVKTRNFGTLQLDFSKPGRLTLTASIHGPTGEIASQITHTYSL